MEGILSLLAGGAIALAGYVKSRSFVRDRLRFVDAAQTARAPFIAGTVATLAAAPVVAILPVIGAGTALAFGASVGLGVALGARDVRRLPGA